MAGRDHRIGVLALQGDFEAHAAAFAEIGAPTVEVRRVHELRGLAALVLPGGESTTLLHLMRDEPWFDALTEFYRAGGAFFATCAGTILLARDVGSPAQPSLGLLDVDVERNGYGRQVDSFEVDLEAGELGKLHGVFIRAPVIRRVGPTVDVLAEHGGNPVLVRQERILAAAFHPELTGDRRLHHGFVSEMISPKTTTIARARDRMAIEGRELEGRLSC